MKLYMLQDGRRLQWCESRNHDEAKSEGHTLILQCLSTSRLGDLRSLWMTGGSLLCKYIMPLAASSTIFNLQPHQDGDHTDMLLTHMSCQPLGKHHTPNIVCITHEPLSH